MDKFEYVMLVRLGPIPFFHFYPSPLAPESQKDATEINPYELGRPPVRTSFVISGLWFSRRVVFFLAEIQRAVCSWCLLLLFVVCNYIPVGKQHKNMQEQ